MIYELKRGAPAYPQIVSDDSDGSPIPWSALSGPGVGAVAADTLLAVWDSAYTRRAASSASTPRSGPAVITGQLTIRGRSATATTIPRASRSRRTRRSGSPARAMPPTAVPNLLLKTGPGREGPRGSRVAAEIIACRAAAAGTGVARSARASRGSRYCASRADGSLPAGRRAAARLGLHHPRVRGSRRRRRRSERQGRTELDSHLDLRPGGWTVDHVVVGAGAVPADAKLGRPVGDHRVRPVDLGRRSSATT